MNQWSVVRQDYQRLIISIGLINLLVEPVNILRVPLTRVNGCSFLISCVAITVLTLVKQML